MSRIGRALARPCALAAAIAAAAALLLAAPQAALAYTVTYTEDWESVPASTINLTTPEMGLPDSVTLTGDEFTWLTSADTEIYEASKTESYGFQAGIFFENPLSTSETAIEGTATLVWENAGYDADGDAIDITLTIENVMCASAQGAVNADCEEYTSLFIVLPRGVCSMQSNVHTTAHSSYSAVRGVTADVEITITKHGTDSLASGRFIFFVSDLDVYNSWYAEGVTLESGFNSTVYLATGSRVAVSSDATTYSASSDYTSGWSDTDDPLGAVVVTSTSAQFSFSWTGPNSGSRLFDSLSHTITAAAGSNGSITDEGETYVGWKNDKSYTATAATGYLIEALTVDTGGVSAASGLATYTYTFEMVMADHEISVSFEPISYTVAFNANGGSGSMGSQAMTYGTSAALTANAFTRTGYTFAGWSTKADGSGTAYADGQSVKNLTTTDGATITLYAQWEPIAYTIAFDGNGGEGAPSSIAATYDVAETVPDDAPARSGYAFTGWNTAADGSGTAYAAGDELLNLTSTAGATVTLYAQWEPVICVEVPTLVACIVMPDGEVVAPSGYEISNKSLVAVETEVDGIAGSQVADATVTRVSTADGTEVFNTSAGYLASFSIGAEDSIELVWSVDDLDATANAELLAAATAGAAEVCYVTFTFEAA